MAYKIPWSNFHELNLDWLLEQVKQLREDVDNITGSAMPSSSIPEMDGVGSPGTEDNYARGDHRHPTDTSRAAQSDLTQEITDRGNADLALASDIADVDAKIKFSAAAPLMDSSSASAGFSDFLARADHIHPTDTSRASETDFQTLKVRVDNITGAASPYDVPPLMDGVASYGTVGAYSRGDHRHPSDSSKLDTAGGTITGDLTLNGALHRPNCARFFESDSTGWVRVAEVPAVKGTRCELTVVRRGSLTPAESHKIVFTYLQNTLRFSNEESNSDVLYINKIRYTDAGAIDIHIDQTAASFIGVFLDAYAPTAASLDNIKLILPDGVADAPVGESILKEYTFTENTERSYSATENGVQCRIKKTGNVVSLTIESANGVSCTQGQYTTVFTLPSWAWPWAPCYTVVDPFGGNNIIGGMITSSGDVQLYPVLSSAAYYRFTITYQV